MVESAIKQLGLAKAVKYFFATIQFILYKFMVFPQLRVFFLRLCGAKIGKGTILCGGIRFINLHRTGFRGLTIGNCCWISEEVLLDLADKITLEDYVTIGQRSMLFTHGSIGYKGHPLQKYLLPASQKPILIKRGSSVSISSTILMGAVVDEESMIMMATVVSIDSRVPSGVLYGGNPGRIVKVLEVINQDKAGKEKKE